MISALTLCSSPFFSHSEDSMRCSFRGGSLSDHLDWAGAGERDWSRHGRCCVSTHPHFPVLLQHPGECLHDGKADSVSLRLLHRDGFEGNGFEVRHFEHPAVVCCSFFLRVSLREGTLRRGECCGDCCGIAVEQLDALLKTLYDTICYRQAGIHHLGSCIPLKQRVHPTHDEV